MHEYELKKKNLILKRKLTSASVVYVHAYVSLFTAT